jgi:seryl-tRNA(Sec) selenium transferase
MSAASLAESPRASAADIPSLDRLLNRPALARLLARYGRTQVTATSRMQPVTARIADKALWLDLRCLEESDEAQFAAQLDNLMAESRQP